jgi:hypothetical protein
MGVIQNIIRKIISSRQKTVLGRWNIDYNHKIIDYKIDMSNEDHCGPCGKYILHTNTTTTTTGEIAKSKYIGPTNDKEK